VRLLLLSNAKREGMGYLEHASGYLGEFLGPSIREILFVPYAGVSKGHDAFVEQVRPVFESLGKRVTGIHTVPDPCAAVNRAQAVVVGGGSTWKLLRELRERRLLPAIRERVLSGMPYAGWSAGANIACPTIMTTNDMPICDPGGFDALALVPFQINPHYLHGNPPGFKGETREERIAEYGVLNPQVWVAGLREGTAFLVEGGAIRLLGEASCRIFRHGNAPRELNPGDDFSFLLARG
jgi:dipeptidase E